MIAPRPLASYPLCDKHLSGGRSNHCSANRGDNLTERCKQLKGKFPQGGPLPPVQTTERQIQKVLDPSASPASDFVVPMAGFFWASPHHAAAGNLQLVARRGLPGS